MSFERVRWSCLALAGVIRRVSCLNICIFLSEIGIDD
jgi:hypothetical protein